jgi:hypothetical protein
MFIAGLEYQRQVSALPMVKRVLRALLAGIPFATLLVGQRVMAERSAASRGPLATRIITGFYGLSIAYVAVSATIWILMAGHTVTHEHCGSGLRCAAAGLLMADYERLGSPQGALDIVTYYLVGTVLANYLLFVLYAWAVCRLAHRQQWSWFRTVQLAALLLGISAGHGSVAFGALCCLAISLPRFVRHGHAEHVRIFADYQRRKRVSAGS